jgi:hypothetical protein
MEEVGIVGCCQTFHEDSHRFGESVVDLVS